MPKFRVNVTLKPALLDSAGRAVGDSLKGMGFEAVQDVRIGKLIELTLADGDAAEVERMCERLLANPVIEDYRIEELS
jgi:phosphoribosylformylglycinamidine synthase